MKNLFIKKGKSGQKIRSRFLLSFIASMPMMSLQAQCPAANVPYTEDFESAVTPALPNCMVGEATQGGGSIRTCSGEDNGFTGKFLCLRNNPGASVNSIVMKFITRGLNLEANTTYKLSYDYGSNVLTNKKLGVSPANASTGLSPMIAAHVVHPGRSSNSVTFTPVASGVYYFYFEAVEQSEGGAAISEFILNVDNITVDVAVPPAITNFTSPVVCGQSTLLTINGTDLENATVTIGGIPVTLATNTASQITANISSSMSGAIAVTTAAGTATSTSNFTFTVTPAITLSGTTTTICAGTASNAVTITSGASAYTAYTWTPSTGVTGNSTSGWIFNPTMSTSYVLNASNPTTACTSNLNYAVEITSSPVAGASLTGNVTITATPAGQTYQWINCTTNVAVAGVTGSMFNAAANGSYKVVVTNANGCKDTSACVNVSKVGLAENSVDLGISLYPNPTDGNVYVTMTETEAAAVTVYDALGKVVLTMNSIHNGTVIDMNNNQKGIYLVKVSNAKGTNVFRIVKK